MIVLRFFNSVKLSHDCVISSGSEFPDSEGRVVEGPESESWDDEINMRSKERLRRPTAELTWRHSSIKLIIKYSGAAPTIHVPSLGEPFWTRSSILPIDSQCSSLWMAAEIAYCWTWQCSGPHRAAESNTDFIAYTTSTGGTAFSYRNK